MAFANRLAILVGGLGGLGSATGKALHKQGANLAILYAPFEAAGLKTVNENYGYKSNDDAGDKVKAYECDITDSGSVEKAFEAIAKDNTAFPSILVNTAGYVNLTALETFPAEDALKHYMVNLYGPTLTGSAFARMYIGRREKDGNSSPPGRIVNIASQAAHVALWHHGPYCASKAGLVNLTKCQASEWGPRGITANSISPGPIMTEMGKKAWADKTAREEYLKNVPTESFAEPEEVARIVTFLCEDSAKSITGVDVRLDGGFCIR